MKYAPGPTLILVAFTLLNFAILYSSFVVDLASEKEMNEKSSEQEADKSVLHFVNYYILEGEKPSLYLNAKVLDLDNITGNVLFDFPKGLAYTPKNEIVHYEADWGKYDKIGQILHLKGKVHLVDESSQIRSRRAKYHIQKEEFWGEGEIESETYSAKTKDKIFVNSHRVYSRPTKEFIDYEGDVNGRIERGRAYEQGIHFWSQQLILNGVTSHIYLKDQVQVKRGGQKATSHKGEIFLENYNKQLKYYTLYDDVKMVEKINLAQGGAVERKAFAERLDGFTRPNQVVLTGYPKVIQENDVIKGNKMTLFENREVIEVDDSHSTFTIKK